MSDRGAVTLDMEIVYDNRTAVVWPRLFKAVQKELRVAKKELIKINAGLDRDITKMENQTGSISLAASLCLYVVTRYVSPKTVFEIGTFIGKSCAAMAYAMDMDRTKQSQIYTCDHSNNFVMHASHFTTQIFPMPKVNSADALQQLDEHRVALDLVHIDGRLGQSDLPLLAKLSHEKTVFAIDDFSVTEKGKKGFFNAALLSNTKPFGDFRLVLPARDTLMSTIGVKEKTTMALLLPPSEFDMFE